jgi:acyl-CoA thioester hydrolase
MQWWRLSIMFNIVKKAAFEGEEIILRTWLDDINALYSFRQYAFYRPQIKVFYLLEIPNGHVFEIATGRPKRMSPFLPMHINRLTLHKSLDFSISYDQSKDVIRF